MSGHDTRQIQQQLEASVRRLQDEDDPQAFARQLTLLAQTLETQAMGLLAAHPSGEPDTSPEGRLHRRALEDYAALQSRLSLVRALLVDRELFMTTLQRKGDDIESLRRSLGFTGAMDEALQHLIHLMQYDTPDRHEVDIRNGFQFSSGSTQYQRFYFAPPRGDHE